MAASQSAQEKNHFPEVVAKKAFKNSVLHEIGLAQLPAKKGRTGITCRNDMSKVRAGMINRKLTAEIPRPQMESLGWAAPSETLLQWVTQTALSGATVLSGMQVPY